jgi:ribosome-binding protein aMBF1 (putative translation factor)
MKLEVYMVDQSFEWNKETIRSLRLRLGWSKSDLARRLKCSSTEVDFLENGKSAVATSVRGELEIILRQAEACSDETKFTPMAENECEAKALEQIDFSRVKEDLE